MAVEQIPGFCGGCLQLLWSALGTTHMMVITPLHIVLVDCDNVAGTRSLSRDHWHTSAVHTNSWWSGPVHIPIYMHGLLLKFHTAAALCPSSCQTLHTRCTTHVPQNSDVFFIMRMNSSSFTSPSPSRSAGNGEQRSEHSVLQIEATTFIRPSTASQSNTIPPVSFQLV